MKKRIAALAVTAAVATPAFAQSSVTLYGVIDEGLNYTNNIGGKGGALEMASGYAQGSRWGLRGNEDLGGGLSAVFQLENGFDASSGKAQEGGRMFGRQAYVGLQDKRLGTVTLGRQYDSVVDYFAPTTANGNWAGYLFSHPYDNDNTDNSFRLDNAVKYASPDFNGLRFGGAYAFSNDTGFANDRTWSVGAQYTRGGLLVAAAYLQANHPGATAAGAIASNDASFLAERMRIFGVGVNYTFGIATVGFAYSNTNYKNPTGNIYLGSPAAIVAPGTTLNALKYQNFELNGMLQLSQSFFVGAEYVLSLEKYDSSAQNVSPKIHTIGLMADYNLSKRTDIYLQGALSKVTGNRTNSILDSGFVLGTDGPASTSNQVAVRLALRHKF
ncbi:porin [Burkholderia sp. 22PA0099]|uniref:porin n=1 Tax=Burkholderia sp. 22PA0099 TaxID=3237372 RepID=UPI0039C3F192